MESNTKTAKSTKDTENTKGNAEGGLRSAAGRAIPAAMREVKGPAKPGAKRGDGRSAMPRVIRPAKQTAIHKALLSVNAGSNLGNYWWSY